MGTLLLTLIPLWSIRQLNNWTVFFLQKEVNSWKYQSQLLLTSYFILVCLNENYWRLLILFLHACLTAQQKGTTARWYSNKTSISIIPWIIHYIIVGIINLISNDILNAKFEWNPNLEDKELFIEIRIRDLTTKYVYWSNFIIGPS